ncbi:3,4-dihydroxy-2-butanone-4-phosphate synthase [Gordonia humi]|uniref:3,4-dihydroxy-2-butanone 4-phosphate synthase/GTP cyclohydrolase II n=1 Tax=Gordonia humi TaxID=686429 RepID=A0A840F620_9ACTN|nr:3,4-dihydroxy-2-butanone-4-phosphate synthase [Gordonia humi]MBB4135680.1 3,4-dihydroxy-2-butanone 4-phosphate synthase/GTP cyclohydrolase II [Gordonia humi]
MSTDRVQTCLSELRAGRPVIVLDDASRENEADLVLAAEYADVDTVAFFLEHTSGFLCVALPAETTDRLRLPQMVVDPTDPLGTAFTVSVDAASGVTTGISAADRARTIALLGDRSCGADDLTRPGHVMPLRARAGGVLSRRGHTEASVDLCAAAGLSPAGLICEMVTPDRRGMLARDDVDAFADRHGLAVVTIDEIVTYRRRTAGLTRGATCRLPTDHGYFEATVYTSATGAEHMALVHGDVDAGTPLVRVHSECLTGDTLASRRCDCGAQLHAAMAQITAAETGIVLYLGGHEGRGIGLAAKIDAYRLQDEEGLDTVDANLALGAPVDARDYHDAAAILADLGVEQIALLSNNPAKRAGLIDAGVGVTRVVGLQTPPTPENADYLATKRDRMGHTLRAAVGVA